MVFFTHGMLCLLDLFSFFLESELRKLGSLFSVFIFWVSREGRRLHECRIFGAHSNGEGRCGYGLNVFCSLIMYANNRAPLQR